MKQKIMVGIAALWGVVVLAIMWGVAPNVYADVTCPDGAAVSSAPSYAECTLAKPEDESKDLWTIVESIISVFLAVLGVAAVAVIIYGGINILFSQGDPGKIRRGKDAILYGLLGLIIASAAFMIVNFVLSGTFSSAGGGGGDGGEEEAVITIEQKIAQNETNYDMIGIGENE